MGFFSKIWKGVKKTFKKIGRGIKKAFKSVGKFMGKIGILGTIALTILTGGLGIGGMFTTLGTKLGALGSTMSGPLAAIMKGASWTIGKAAQFGSAIKSGFSTLTKGVTEFFGQTAKFIGNKLNITNIQGAPGTLSEAWSNASQAVSKQFETFKGDVGDLFTKTSPTLEAGKAGLSFGEYKEFMSKPQTLSEFKASKSPLDFQQSPLSEPVPSTESLLDLPKNPAGPMSPVVDPSKVVTADNKNFLARAGDKLTDPSTYVDPVVEGVANVPAAALTQYSLNAFMGTPDYSSLQGSGSFIQQFQSGDRFGAVAQGLTPIANDGFIDSIVAYDSLGQNSGGFGPSQLYSQRLGAFG